MFPVTGRFCSKLCQAKNARLLLRKSIYSSHEKGPGAPEPVVDPNDDKRNISRLPKYLRDRLEDNAGPMTYNPKFYSHGADRRVLRRWYAKVGEKSGIHPSIGFPTKEELQEIIEDEKEWEPTLQERIATVEAEKAAIAEQRRQHEAHVKKQMEKMPQFIAQYKQKLKKADAEVAKLEEKKKALLEEARDYYGYRIDDKDPRFHQLQEKKMEEELAAKKKKKKEERKAREAEAIRKLSSKKA